MQLEFLLKEGVTWQEAWDEEADAKFEFYWKRLLVYGY